MQLFCVIEWSKQVVFWQRQVFQAFYINLLYIVVDKLAKLRNSFQGTVGDMTAYIQELPAGFR